jgi:hypothetical protein
MFKSANRQNLRDNSSYTSERLAVLSEAPSIDLFIGWMLSSGSRIREKRSCVKGETRNYKEKFHEILINQSLFKFLQGDRFWRKPSWGLVIGCSMRAGPVVCQLPGGETEVGGCLDTAFEHLRDSVIRKAKHRFTRMGWVIRRTVGLW